VDVDVFRPEPREQALTRLLEESRRDPPNPGNANERLPDEGNAERLAVFPRPGASTILYFGKLLRNKGVHLLLEALDGIDARAVIVGFGDYRAELEAMAGPNVLFTGPLEHRHLVHLIPLTDVTVVPSIFPEAFGMVVAEAAAGGSIPLVDRHSGLAEIAEALGSDLTSFDTGDVADLRAKLERLLALSPHERDELKQRARRVTEERWSWAMSPIGCQNPLRNLRRPWPTSSPRTSSSELPARPSSRPRISTSQSRRSSRSSIPRRCR
jgi:glycosyltransferase involved in cell wall biosynthesis